MAKNEKRTLDVILAEMNTVVNNYNELDMADVNRVTLKKQATELAKEYNELSMLTVYATCLEDKMPVKAFVEAGTYKTKRIKESAIKEPDKDGCLHLKLVCAVEDSKVPANLDLMKFLEWAAAKNKQAAYAADWRTKIAVAKDTIRDSYRKSFAAKGDTHKLSIKKLKSVLQDMFDALIFIPTAKGENSVIADKDIAIEFREFATKTNTKLAESDKLGEVLPGDVWNALIMKGLKSAVEGKKLTVDFDCAEATKAESEDETDAEETTESETK